ncbi:OmpA family protein [Enterovirga sp.]|uniref:OmpA family protein n=1 Tax=Enterovirga sp. TaxID=2026350 RepID=UPI002BBA18DB|nr:OmpA family protein [Enterovirga sp.]HMO29200.1 OmpA family protein [Enterovirga sp.]
MGGVVGGAVGGAAVGAGLGAAMSGREHRRPDGTVERDPANFDELRAGRREVQEGGRTVIREPGGRTIFREDGRMIIRSDDADRFRSGPGEHRMERRGGEFVYYARRPGGPMIVTYTDPGGRLIRRSMLGPDGREVILIDNAPRPGGSYFVPLPPPVIAIPRERYIVEGDDAPYADVYGALVAPPVERLPRPFTLDEIRYSPQVRARMPSVDLDSLTFDTGSWVLSPDQIGRLGVIAQALKAAIDRNPREVFLIEGHTDAVGSPEDNLSLSDRRAESVAVALQERFGVPAENLTTQGYGEQQLKVQSQGPERRNRRVTVRRITPLLAEAGPAGAAPAPR